MPLRNSLTVDDLIARHREKQREILKTLKPELYAEYRRLGRKIKELRAEQADQTPVGASRRQHVLFALPPRIPLFEHKKRVLEFLRNREGATRRQIMKATKVPPGSLSSVLKAKEFRQIRHGFWGLTRAVKEETREK